MLEPKVTLDAVGWNPTLEAAFDPHSADALEPARVAIEDKHHYVLVTRHGQLLGIVSGKLLHDTPCPADLPKVGDWVAYRRMPNEAKGVIHHVLPRRTKLSRKLAGRESEEQVLATNVDTAFLVFGLDRPFNPALLNRFLVMVREGGAKSVVVLNKSDVCDDVSERVATAGREARGAPVIAVSAKTGDGMDALSPMIHAGETVVFIGTSGVGKSSLINCIYGDAIQATMEVRETDAKGRHTTTWRELIVLPQGGCVIDTPGMREFHMWLAGEGIHEAFSDIDALAVGCHFRDCTHTVEKRCAVQAALARGELSRKRYEAFLKLRREIEFLEEAQTHRWQTERKRRTKIAQRRFNAVKRNLEAE